MKLNENPKEYVIRLLKEMQSGNARIWITNLLKNSYLESDKEFYSQALKELDLLIFKYKHKPIKNDDK